MYVCISLFTTSELGLEVAWVHLWLFGIIYLDSVQYRPCQVFVYRLWQVCPSLGCSPVSKSRCIFLSFYLSFSNVICVSLLITLDKCVSLCLSPPAWSVLSSRCMHTHHQHCHDSTVSSAQLSLPSIRSSSSSASWWEKRHRVATKFTASANNFRRNIPSFFHCIVRLYIVYKF